MKISHLNWMHNGWFVGDSLPTTYQTRAVEIGVQHFSAGDTSVAHHHNIATEITVIISGHASMNQMDLYAGDIVSISPGEIALFQAITDVITAVVKLPKETIDKHETSPC